MIFNIQMIVCSLFLMGLANALEKFDLEEVYMENASVERTGSKVVFGSKSSFGKSFGQLYSNNALLLDKTNFKSSITYTFTPESGIVSDEKTSIYLSRKQADHALTLYLDGRVYIDGT